MSNVIADLLPCPFCGGETHRHEADRDIVGAVAIGCSDCGALGPFMDEADFSNSAKMWAAAELAWNARAEIARAQQ